MSPEPARLDPAAIGVTSLIVVEGVKLFHDLAPSIAKVRENDGDPATTAELRTAEMMASAVMLLAGFSVAYVTGNSVPVWIAAGAVALVVGLSEYSNSRAPADG